MDGFAPSRGNSPKEATCSGARKERASEPSKDVFYFPCRVIFQSPFAVPCFQVPSKLLPSSERRSEADPYSLFQGW